MKFFEICFVDDFQQKNNATTKLFLDSAFFGRFLTKKQLKKNKKIMAKSKPFDEIFLNLVCRCFPTKKMLQKTFFGFRPFSGRF